MFFFHLRGGKLKVIAIWSLKISDANIFQKDI